MSMTVSCPLAELEASLSYKEQWKVRRDTSSTKRRIVFDLLWDGTRDDGWIVGCTNGGELLVWRAPPEMTLPAELQIDEYTGGDDHVSGGIRGSPDPVLRQNVSQGALYSCSMDRVDGQHALLIISGDEGVFIFDWEKQIQPHLTASSGLSQRKNPAIEPVICLHPHKALNPPEINQALLCRDGKHVIGAAGDAFGAYKWDLEQNGTIVATYPTIGRGIPRTLPGSLYTVALSGEKTLLTGGESGFLAIWDIQQDKQIDRLDIGSDILNPTRGSQQSTYWVSSCLADNSHDNCFWAIAGGNKEKNGGFVAALHSSTRTVLASTTTHACPQALNRTTLPLSPGTSSEHTYDQLLSVGNDGCTTVWDPWTLEQKRCIASERETSFALAVGPDGRRMAVSGLGATVDVLEDGCLDSFQLRM